MATLTIWTDITCPWSYAACIRLHRMRDHLDLDVELDFRARPVELAIETLPDRAWGEAAVAALAQHEHTAFASQDRRWSSSTIPAWEAQKWGYSQGTELGERFDLALRRAFFLHGHDVSLRHELAAVAGSEGLDASSLIGALDTGTYRKHVMADFADAEQSGISETPVIVLADGTSHANPGIGTETIRGIPIITDDHPSAYADLLHLAAAED